MGGQKKPTIKQMLKRQLLRELKAKGKKALREKRKEAPTMASIFMPEINEDLISKLRDMKAITPYELASAYGIRVSVANDLLEELERRRIVRLVSRSRNLKIYAVESPTLKAD